MNEKMKYEIDIIINNLKKCESEGNYIKLNQESINNFYKFIDKFNIDLVPFIYINNCNIHIIFIIFNSENRYLNIGFTFIGNNKVIKNLYYINYITKINIRDYGSIYDFEKDIYELKIGNKKFIINLKENKDA